MYGFQVNAGYLDKDLQSVCELKSTVDGIKSFKVTTNNKFFWQRINSNDFPNYKVRVVTLDLMENPLDAYDQVLKGDMGTRVICPANNCPDSVLSYSFSQKNDSENIIHLQYNRTQRSAILKFDALGIEVKVENCIISDATDPLS